MNKIYIQISFYLFVILCWQLSVSIFNVPEYIFPSPLDIAEKFETNFVIFLKNAGITILETVVGFVIGSIIAITLAVFIHFSKIFEILIKPVLIISQTTPRIAIAPLLLIWFGYGILPKIIIVIIISFFPVVVNTIKGLRSAEPELLDLMKSYRSSKWDILIKVRFPSALPFIFSGLKVGITFAVIGAVVAEFVGGNSGLGYLIIQGSSNLDTSLIFASVILLSLIGVLLYKAVLIVEKKTLFWNRGISQEL